MRKEPAIIRFLRKFKRTDGCWLWTAAKDRGGYGLFYPSYEETIHAHRYAYMLRYGEFDRSLMVLHNCPGGDNPACVNPDHLFLGTQADNMQDMARKGRHGRAAFTAEDIREIRRRVAAGEVQRQIAFEKGVDPATICGIIKGKNYSYVK